MSDQPASERYIAAMKALGLPHDFSQPAAPAPAPGQFAQDPNSASPNCDRWMAKCKARFNRK